MIIQNNQIQINTRWYSIIPQNTINKKIQQLCDENPSFNNYYHRGVIPHLDTGKIFWVIDPELTSLNGEAIPDLFSSPPVHYCIILPKISESSEDAFIIAHEIGHCIMNELKFPIVQPFYHLAIEMGEYKKSIFNAFNSAIYDKIVNAKLKEYNFDLTGCIDRPLPPIQPRDNNELILRTFLYVIKRRNARLLIDTNHEYEEYLLSRYSEQFFEIKEKGDIIFNILETDPSNSPNEIQNIINKIAELWNWRCIPVDNSIMIRIGT
jgi:hypothetical protein